MAKPPKVKVKKGFLVLAVALVAVTCAAGAVGPRLSLVSGPAKAEAGRPATVVVALTRDGKPVAGSVTVWIEKSGTRRSFSTTASTKGRYRAAVVFPSAGRWLLGARVGRTTRTLRTVDVRSAALTPLAFAWPTSIDLQPDGSLLLVENGLSRVVRVQPETGKVATVAASLTKPFGVARAPSGSIFVSAGHSLQRLGTAGKAVTVAEADADIGPLTIAGSGDVYYCTGARVFKLEGGVGPARRVAGTAAEGGGGDGGLAVNAQLSGPHGLAVASDGALLVSDTGNGRIRRIDPTTGVITAFAQVGSPRGLEVAADGTIYVVDASTNHVVHLSGTGVRIGLVGPAFDDPYDLDVTGDGVVYVIDTAASGRVRRVARDGTATTLSR